MRPQSPYAPEDLERIKQAVWNAEVKVSGEIVPVVVNTSGNYTIAKYRGAILMATLALSVIVVIDRFVMSEFIFNPAVVLLIAIIAGAAGSGMVAFIEPVKRLLLTKRHVRQATRLRAESFFLEEEVFNTRHRTGMMIFISRFEKEVIILADRGISRVVDQKNWDTLVNDLTEQIKEDNLIEGLQEAIQRCTEILLKHGFYRTTDDVNELRDNLRIY